MKYATIKYNDIANAPGVCVSFYTQGCPHHCYNCFNPETWDFNGGKEFTSETISNLLNGLYKNGVKRDLCILGGEPLCKENIFITCLICDTVRRKYPEIKIYIWTGYTKEEFEEVNDPKINRILDGTYADYLIDGPFIEAEKDLSLLMRGSKNQRIIKLNKGDT